MKIVKATERYEAWLSKYTSIVSLDLRLKHQRMAEDVFSFLRATFYRWVELWRTTCPELARAPEVLAVGDLHVENFGTWRDIEGRLIWGINDFDEVCKAPYAIDLVRLAASAHLAIAAGHLAIEPKDACGAILKSYRKALAAGGEPFVLEAKHAWLRRVATSELRNPVRFWEKMDALLRLRRTIPGSARKALGRLMPEPGLKLDLRHRVAGLGSLGRERYVALADWKGGHIAREAKALAPSAYAWACGGKGSKRIFYQLILRSAVRCLDPFVDLKGRWIVRRLGPLCSRVELSSLPKERDELRLLEAMGWETANVHLGSPGSIAAVERDLKRRSAGWLHEAAQQMVKATTTDWQAWKKK